MIITIRHPQHGELSLCTWAHDKDLLTLIGSLHFCSLSLEKALQDFLQEAVIAIDLIDLGHTVAILNHQTGEVELASTVRDLLILFPNDTYQISTLLQVFNNLAWDDSIATRELFLKHFAYEDLEAPVPLGVFNIGDALLARVQDAGITMSLGAYKELEDAYEDIELRVIKELYTESAPTVEFLADLYAYDPMSYLVDELGSTLAMEPKARKHITLSKFIRPGWPHSRIRRSYEFKVMDLGLDMGYVTWTDPDAGDMLPQPGYVIRISDYPKGE